MVRVGRTKTFLHSELSERDVDAASHPTLYDTAAEANTRIDGKISTHDALATSHQVACNSRIDTKIATHKADASAHHVKTPDPTKEIWLPVNWGSDYYQYGYHVGGRIDDAADKTIMMLRVPHDFSSLVAIELIILSFETAADMHITVGAEWAKPGEEEDTHSDLAANLSMGSVTLDYLKALNISAAVNAATLEPGDIVAINVFYSATATDTNVLVLGVRFRYS